MSSIQNKEMVLPSIFFLLALFCMNASAQVLNDPSLKHAPSTHTIFVFSDPPSSEIYIDGNRQKVPTPAIVRVPANSKPSIVIKHKGHKPFKKVVETQGENSEIHAVLKKRR